MKYENPSSEESAERKRPMGSLSRQAYHGSQQVRNAEELKPGKTYYSWYKSVAGDIHGYATNDLHLTAFEYVGPATKVVNGETVEDPRCIETITSTEVGKRFPDTVSKAGLGLEPFEDGSWCDSYTIDNDKEPSKLDVVREKLHNLFGR